MALSKKQKKLKIKEFKEGTLVEGSKSKILVRGNKTNETLNSIFKELKQLAEFKYLNHRRYLYPFEETKAIEELCVKQLSSIFILGHHMKKRPNNLVFGRLFNSQILDMYELGVTHYEPLQKGVTAARNSRPLLIFQGDPWETDPIYKNLKSLFVDIFGGPPIKAVDILGITRALVFTAQEEIQMIQYEIQHDPSLCKTIQEIGPKIKFVLRRNQIQYDLVKFASKQPKTHKKEKNIEQDLTGKRGRVWVHQEDINNLALKKRKGLKSLNKDKENKSETMDLSINGAEEKPSKEKKEKKKEKKDEKPKKQKKKEDKNQQNGKEEKADKEKSKGNQQ